MGKSTYACQLSVEAGIRAKVPTLVVSAEMTRREWGAWMAAYLSKTTTESLTRPLREELRAQWLASPIAIADQGTVTIKQIRELSESRLGLKLLIVDHIGLVNATRKDNRVLEVGEVCRGLKAIAKDLDCTVLSLCQLNRRVEGSEDKQPRLDDLRESGEIEHSADSVWFLWTDERDLSRAELPMTLTLEKNRHGPVNHWDVMCDRAHRSFRFMREAGDDSVPF
jgi:replicative DNA helicase